MLRPVPNLQHRVRLPVEETLMLVAQALDRPGRDVVVVDTHFSRPGKHHPHAQARGPIGKDGISVSNL